MTTAILIVNIATHERLIVALDFPEPAAARTLVRYDVPVLGVNRGRLGFLTDVSPDEIEQRVGEVLDGHYRIEKRFLLDATVKHNGKPYRNRYIGIFRFRNTEIVSWREYHNPEETARAMS